MANYYCSWRSNYFRVRDVENFKKWLSLYSGAEFMEEERHNTKLEEQKQSGILEEFKAEGGKLYGILQNCGESAFPEGFRWDPETNSAEECDFLGELAEHLADGEVAIFMETGSEKLRYLLGVATAVHSSGEREILTLNKIYDLAKEKWPGCDPTPCEY